MKASRVTVCSGPGL
uniref:Uncharacterized protein n=1 Tax=Arundo donax TaxID=35708 RepID=A0A0A9AS70_ARUDO